MTDYFDELEDLEDVHYDLKVEEVYRELRNTAADPNDVITVKELLVDEEIDRAERVYNELIE